MSSTRITKKQLIDREYEKESFAVKSLQMKQHLVFDTSTDPAHVFCQCFGAEKPKEFRFWKDFINDKVDEKPRFYTDTSDRLCVMVSIDHDKMPTAIDLVYFFINNGTNKNYKFEKYIVDDPKVGRALGFKIRDQVFILRVTKPADVSSSGSTIATSVNGK